MSLCSNAATLHLSRPEADGLLESRQGAFLRVFRVFRGVRSESKDFSNPGFSNGSANLCSAVHMQRTFVIFKPDCMAQRHVGEVLKRFENAGFTIVGCKMGRLTPALLREHYAHVASKPFYPEIEAFMSERPVIMMALEGDNIVQKVRDLLGPTDSRKAAKGTIRGDFGTEMMKNVVHASDSDENAKLELARFFKAEELFAI